jgi:hypothetical protein
MFGLSGLKLITAGALAIAAVPSLAGALRDNAATTIELSAQAVDPKKQAPKTVAPKPAAPRVTPQVHPRIIQRQVIPQQKNLGVTTTPRIVTPGTSRTIPVKKTFTPKGNNARVVTTAKIRSTPARGVFRTSIRGRNYSVWRSGHRVGHGGGWRTFVALSALGAIAIGGASYYPYAYIDAPADYCEGLTEDGCQMVYDEVETMEGDAVGQCVAYCPWQ